MTYHPIEDQMTDLENRLMRLEGRNQFLEMHLKSLHQRTSAVEKQNEDLQNYVANKIKVLRKKKTNLRKSMGELDEENQERCGGRIEVVEEEGSANVDTGLMKRIDDLKSRLNRLKVLERPKSCADLLASGRSEGVIKLSTYTGTYKGLAFCDGPWLVFQRRENGKISFNCGWDDYKKGFGDVRDEYWLGLEAVRHLTSHGSWDLRVDLRLQNGSGAYAIYHNFRLSAAVSHYRLRYDRYLGGTAGDSLSEDHRGEEFYTKDRPHRHHTPITAHGGWWYKHCCQANLNGDYFSSSPGKGMVWASLTGRAGTVPFSVMKMRKV